MKKFENILKTNKKDFGNSFLSSLLEIPDCPKNIFSQGKLFEKKDFKFLAVVGSRNHSVYAKQVLEKLMSEIAGENIVIISGLALGIDTLAHTFALQNNLKTITIPGSGISESVIYPRSNINLAKNILSASGIILSEFEPKEKTMPYFFPQRNRIMAGLSDAVLVVEAGEKSGTLITARLATDYNKDLLTIPQSIFSQFSVGSNRLLKQGAHPIFCGNDILEILGIKTDEEKKHNQKKLNFDDFTKIESSILKLLQEPKNKDELLEILKISITELNMNLSILEIKNVIDEKLGKYILK